LPGTQVLPDEKEIVKTIKRFQANTKTFWGACVNSSLPSFSVVMVKQGYIDAKKRGVRILYITEITEDNLPYCREIMRFAELRHLRGVKGNFAMSDTVLNTVFLFSLTMRVRDFTEKNDINILRRDSHTETRLGKDY
jgi:hypothetical protein